LQRKKVNCFSNHSFRVFYSKSNGGASNELTDDPDFVPLNADDPIYGPPALLLFGFVKDETSKVLQLLKDLDGEFLKVIHCTEDMLSLTVWDAMHTQQPNLEAVEVAKSMPRMCILSGLSGEEMLMFIDAFPEAGFGSVVFASLVPKSANKLLRQVVEEIIGDHEMMMARQSE